MRRNAGALALASLMGSPAALTSGAALSTQLSDSALIASSTPALMALAFVMCRLLMVPMAAYFCSPRIDIDPMARIERPIMTSTMV